MSAQVAQCTQLDCGCLVGEFHCKQHSYGSDNYQGGWTGDSFSGFVLAGEVEEPQTEIEVEELAIDWSNCDDRVIALKNFLDDDSLKPTDFDFISNEYTENFIKVDGHGEFAVLTDIEATDYATVEITQGLWSFNSAFLANETGFSIEVFEKLSQLYEESQDAIFSLVESSCGLDMFVDSAIGADGRGNFIAMYDKKEHVEDGDDETYFIYQLNEG